MTLTHIIQRILRALPAAFLAALLAALLLAGCREKPALLRLYSTTDASGFLTPCG